MSKIYKYYLYYFNDELYAYTDIKEYAKEFEKIRDMKKFVKLKREITREDVNMLAEEEQGKYLVKQTFNIYDDETMSWFESEFIITQLERTGINNIAVQVMNEDLYKYCWDSSPSIFNNKIINALKILDYTAIYERINGQRMEEEYYGEYDDTTCIQPDMLGIFLHYYGKTLKGV